MTRARRAPAPRPPPALGSRLVSPRVRARAESRTRREHTLELAPLCARPPRDEAPWRDEPDAHATRLSDEGKAPPSAAGVRSEVTHSRLHHAVSSRIHLHPSAHAPPHTPRWSQPRRSMLTSPAPPMCGMYGSPRFRPEKSSRRISGVSFGCDCTRRRSLSASFCSTVTCQRAGGHRRRERCAATSGVVGGKGGRARVARGTGRRQRGRRMPARRGERHTNPPPQTPPQTPPQEPPPSALEHALSLPPPLRWHAHLGLVVLAKG